MGCMGERQKEGVKERERIVWICKYYIYIQIVGGRGSIVEKNGGGKVLGTSIISRDI